MLQVKCIKKIRDKNNHIIEYKLINNNGNAISVKTNDLKEFIRLGQIEVTNLTLTSDNRLIDNIDNNIESLLNRVKTLGYTINAFDTDCGHKCYIASSIDHLKHIFIIPDDVKYIYNLSGSLAEFQNIYGKKIYKCISNIKDSLKVIGGKSLVSTKYMFYCCKAHSLDLSSFDTSNVTNMENMFNYCRAQSIDLRSFDTSKVTNMNLMFDGCKAKYLDLNSFNTSNVTDMFGMFEECEAQSIDLSSFDTSNVTRMACMFQACKAQYLDLRSFNTSNVTDMSGMFSGCKAQSIDLRSFNTSNVINMSSMFSGCEAQSLDLTSFNTSNVTDMSHMFQQCEAQSIDLSSFDTNKVKKMKYMFQGCMECTTQVKVKNNRIKSQLCQDRRR